MSYQSQNFTPAASTSEIQRLLYHMPSVAAQANNEWASGFAKSVTRQSRQRNWQPSHKQLSMMRRLVSDLFAYGVNAEEDFNPIES